MRRLLAVPTGSGDGQADVTGLALGLDVSVRLDDLSSEVHAINDRSTGSGLHELRHVLDVRLREGRHGNHRSVSAAASVPAAIATAVAAATGVDARVDRIEGRVDPVEG